MGCLRFEDSGEIATCEHWLSDPNDEDEGRFCDSPSTLVAISRSDWRLARPLCPEHKERAQKYWITANWKLAHRVQLQMAAIELLDDLAYWASSDALSDLVGDAEAFSATSRYLAARLDNALRSPSISP